ncbi:histamine H3 receptor-like [Ambystoma mexicanum]|uniref:histamine H3 receptor-like n=1 Tax=Ambystoma mexicanum TaxID=8296 RepID=UPI0037E932D3
MSTSLLNTSGPFEGDISATNISHPTIEAQIAPNHLVIIKNVALALMIGVTGTGNALVILSFVVDANLRTQSNFFLLNLAICDFCIGTFSTPLYMINYIMNGKWILGRPVCKMWLAIDYVICQCSIYTIILISYDRFLAVTKAVAYRDQQNRMKAAVLKMMAIWILAFLVYGPVILFWEYVAGYSKVPDGECNPEFFYIQYFRLWSSIIFFFTPLVPILYFNMNVYINVRTRMKAKQRPLGAPAGKPKARSDTTPIFTVPYLRSTETNINSFPKQERSWKSAGRKLAENLLFPMQGNGDWQSLHYISIDVLPLQSQLRATLK